MKKCNSCGAENTENSKFCKYCGANLIAAPEAEQVDSAFEQVPPQQSGNNQGFQQVPPQQRGNGQGFQQVPPQQRGNDQGFQQVPPQQGGMNQGYPNQQGGMNQGYPQGGMNQGRPQGGMNQGYPQGGMNQGYPNQQGGPYGYGSMPPQQKKSNLGLIVALIVTAIVLLFGGVIFLVLTKTGAINLGKHKKNDTTVVNNSAAPEENIEINQTVDQTSEASSEITDTSFDGLMSHMSDRSPMYLRFVSADVTDYPTVKMYYTVEDSNGTSLILSSPNAAIRETVSNGQEIERTIKKCERLEGNQGVSFDICADKSGSMESDIDTMKSIMSQFVDALDYGSGDKAELISFDSYVMYMCTYTQDSGHLKNGINNMVADGGTAFYDALYEGVTNASVQEGARCVIAFTDGDDNESYHTSEEVINLANSKNVPIFIIGTSTGYINIYQDIADRTGGKCWTIGDINDMSEVLNEIYGKEKDMYCIEYESDGSYDAYSERKVSCVMLDDSYSATTVDSFTPTEVREQKAHSSRYEVIKENISWSEANAKCIENGGHLVTITSEDEMNQVSSLCESAGIKYVWMGGYTSVYGDSSFGHWITGENFDYTAWYPGEPSRQDRADGVEEMYLMLWCIDDEWSWNDQREDVMSTGLKYFDGNLGYVCEYED